MLDPEFSAGSSFRHPTPLSLGNLNEGCPARLEGNETLIGVLTGTAQCATLHKPGPRSPD